MLPQIYIRNKAEIALGTNTGFVTTDLHAIPQKSHWQRTQGLQQLLYIRNTAEIGLGTNIGFITFALHANYCRSHIGNEHKVCNHRFRYKIRQETDWEFTYEVQQKSNWKRT